MNETFWSQVLWPVGNYLQNNCIFHFLAVNDQLKRFCNEGLLIKSWNIYIILILISCMFLSIHDISFLNANLFEIRAFKG